MNRKTTFILGAALLAAALVLVIALTDYPPNNADAVGTIGAADTTIAGVEPAQRYRTEQISAEAVTLEDSEVQELLQNDAVLRLVRDPAFQRALSNEHVSRAFQYDAFQRALLQEDFQRALAMQSHSSASTLGQHSRDAVLLRQDRADFVQRLSLNTDLARALAQNDDFALALFQNEPLARAISQNENLSRALAQSTELQRLFADRQALAFLSDIQLQGSWQSEGFGQLMQRQGVLARMALDSNFNRLLLARAQQMQRTAE